MLRLKFGKVDNIPKNGRIIFILSFFFLWDFVITFDNLLEKTIAEPNFFSNCFTSNDKEALEAASKLRHQPLINLLKNKNSCERVPTY